MAARRVPPPLPVCPPPRDSPAASVIIPYRVIPVNAEIRPINWLLPLLLLSVYSLVLFDTLT